MCVVREQSLLPQNVPIWLLDYFRLIVFKEQKTQDFFFSSPPNCLKVFRQRGCSKAGAITIDNDSIIWTRCDRQEGTQQDLYDQSPMSHCFWMGQRTFVSQMFTLSSSCEFPFFSLKPQTPTPYPLVQNIHTSFCLSLESLVFMWIPHMYIIKCDSLQLICLVSV